MAALWIVLALPRWVFLSGLALLAFVAFREQTVIAGDPDAVMPLFLQSDLLGVGTKGLVVTGLVAAYMSTFSSEINATASIIVRDLYQPIFRHEDDGEEGGHMLPSYIATAGLTVGTIVLGYVMVRNSSLNNVWMWMLGGLVIAMYTLYMSPVYFMGKWYAETSVTVGLFGLCCVALYFTWYKTLPDD